MKQHATINHYIPSNVAPRRGAWIETLHNIPLILKRVVAPRRGAWIETRNSSAFSNNSMVAPRRGAWIETNERRLHDEQTKRRAPQGRVD